VTIQEIFNQLGNRPGVTKLAAMNSLWRHCYKHDAFKKGSIKLDEFLLELGLTRHMLNDPRLQMLIDLQRIGKEFHEDNWMWAVMQLALEYDVAIVVGMKDA
jgi:hypothetical protein